jgi:uncharacterized protein YlxP (DUF503 family)
MPVGLLVLHIHLPGCSSLKEKRSRLKPLLARLHREFNISVAEMDYQDVWQDAVIACALVSNENGQTQRSLQVVSDWIDSSWPDVFIADERIEIL